MALNKKKLRINVADVQEQIFDEYNRNTGCHDTVCGGACKQHIGAWKKKVKDSWKYECSICMVSGAGYTRWILPCGHSYHPNCIKPWFENNSTCPNCRHEAPDTSGRVPGSFFGIYLDHLKDRINLINVHVRPEVNQIRLARELQAQEVHAMARERQLASEAGNSKKRAREEDNEETEDEQEEETEKETSTSSTVETKDKDPVDLIVIDDSNDEQAD